MSNEQQPQVPQANAPGVDQDMGYQQTQPPKRGGRILGLHPALFMGIALLVLVAILAIVLVFTGEIASQGPRVFWTVVGFVAFTGLLALDLTLSRSSSRPLVIGTATNGYMIIVLMLTIWIYRSVDRSGYDYGVWDLWYQIPYIVLTTRAVWGLAWLVLTSGERMKLAIGRGFGFVTAGLIALAGVLMTLHLPLQRFGVDVGDWYWRSLVAVVILAALAACILLLLVWNQRNDEVAARPKPPVPPAPHYGNPQEHQGYPPGYPAPGYPAAAPGEQGPAYGAPGQPPPGQPQQGQPPQGPPPQYPPQQ